MQNTSHYSLNLYEGSDIFNPLIVENGNTETIDTQMYANDIACIGLATELKNGTVHALTRTTHTDAPMFRFIATSKYNVGDTFTVDGVQVSALLSDGTTLSDGAYVINSNVLCCLTGTVLTMYTVPGAIQTAQNALKLGGELPSYYGKASDVTAATNTANAAGVLANQVNTNLSNNYYTKTQVDEKINTTYVSQETVVGTWIDNKPIYRKIISGTFSASYDYTKVDSQLTNGYIDNLLSVRGTTKANNGIKTSIPNYISSAFYIGVAAQADGLYVNHASGIRSQSYTLVLEYTKA